MDFRMNVSSIFMLIFMMLTFMYFIISGFSNIGAVGYLQAFGFSLVTLITLLGIVSIPVFIVCYFIERIPDIDYSIVASFGIVVLGIIIELLF